LPISTEKHLPLFKSALVQSDYLVGDQFTAADLLLTSVLTWAHAYGIELTTRLQAYSALHTARSAFKTAATLNFSISAGA
jgi:glutathione S-transferase